MKLVSIKDLEQRYKQMLGEVTVVNRIESLLEDMNLTPHKIVGQIELGSTGRRTHVFHASMIGELSGRSLCGKYPMGCGRKLYYSYIGEPSEGAIEPKLQRIFDTGTAIHTQLQSYLGEIAQRSEGEFEFTPEADISPDNNKVADRMDISGHTDGIITVHVPDLTVRFGLEIKSINDNGYKATKGPHAEHIMQGTVYQACLDLPVFLFLYYSKNDSNMAEFIHPFDKLRWQAIVDKLTYVQEMAMKKEMPPREVSYQCSTCRWKKTCKPPKSGRPNMTKLFQIRKGA
jgi:CRISPR/Cas system-associated exonuclease Cas4 (RecB family)